MLPGDVALYRPHNTVGHAISILSASPYCHIRMITDTDGNTVEADFGGAIRGHVQDGDVIVTIPLTDAQRTGIPAAAAAMVGIPYGYADIAALALAAFGLRLPILTHRLGRPDRLFCSQLVDLTWQAVGFHAFDDGRLPQAVTPGDIADLAFVSNWHTITERKAQ